MAPIQFLALPEEIVIAILRCLDFREILVCSATCSALQQTVKQSVELQYRIELALDGMIDGPPGLLTIAERLELLRDRRWRWKTLDWTNTVAVPIPGACQAYELVGGVFAKSMSIGHTVGSHHLVATWLPSRTEPMRQIIRDDLGLASRDFAVDPSQDLIALVDADNTSSVNDMSFVIKVYLRTISTNAPHPKAQRSELFASIPFELGNSFIQIVDDVVGMFFWVHGAGLIIWNWVTSEVLVSCVGLDLPPLAWDFAFLSNRAFMITATAGSGTIEVFSFSENLDEPAEYPSQHASSSSQRSPRAPTHVATLFLPPLQPGQEPHHFSTHSAPFVHGIRPGKPFTTSRESRVHLLSLHYGERSPRYHMFMHNRFLLSLIRDSFGSGEKWERIVRPWETWGPENTRFLEHNVQFQWLRYVHGQRVILPPFFSIATPDEAATLCVIDFNVDRKNPIEPKTIIDPEGLLIRSYEVVVVPSTIPAGPVFQIDVVTHLPYSVSSRSGPFNYSGFMIDDERIVGMKSMAFSDGNMSDVDVFTF